VTAPQTQALTLFELFEAKAGPALYQYDAAFVKAASVTGPEVGYADEFIYLPPGGDGPNVGTVRIPVPLTAPELRPFKGRNQFIKNSTGFIDLTKSPYQEGIADYLDKINAHDWIGFNIMPGVYANLVSAWPSRNTVPLLNSAENTASWNGVTNFLAATQYSNPYNKKMTLPGTTTLATYQNFWANTLPTVPNVQAMIADMSKRRGFDGNPLGYTGTHVFSSPDLFPTVRALCEDEKLPGGATNPLVKWKLKPIQWFDLNPKRWGLLHKDENRPIFAATKGSPRTQVYGVQSAMYEKTRKVGWDVYVWLAAALARQESISVADTG
jgi:hypothetical protein